MPLRGHPAAQRPPPPTSARVRRNSSSSPQKQPPGARGGPPPVLPMQQRASHPPSHPASYAPRPHPDLAAADHSGSASDWQPGQLPPGRQPSPPGRQPADASPGGRHYFAIPPPRALAGPPPGYAYAYAYGYAPPGYGRPPPPGRRMHTHSAPGGYGPAPGTAGPFQQPWLGAAGWASPGRAATGRTASPGVAAFQMAAALHERDRQQRRRERRPSRAARELAALSVAARPSGASGASPGSSSRLSARAAAGMALLRRQGAGNSLPASAAAGTAGRGDSHSPGLSEPGSAPGFGNVGADSGAGASAVHSGGDVWPGSEQGAGRMGGNGWEGNAAVGSDQQRGYSGESREGLHGDGGAGIGAGHPAGMGLGAGGGVEPEEEDPVLAKARQRRALTTLRFFMRRFVRFHLSRIHSEVKAVQTRFFEIIVYLLFCLFVILSSVTSRQDQDYFWAANAMQSQIVSQEFPKQYSDWVKSFQDVETLEDVYVWMSGPMHTTLYEEDATWWGAFPPNGASNSSAEREGLFFGTNRLIGGVRVSQLRSRERADECVSLAVLAPSSSIRCFAHDSEVFTPDDETTDAAGFPVPLYPFEGSNQSLMQASVAEERGRIGLATFRADSGREYPVPAFTVILPHSGAVRAAAVIEGLWRHGYVDSQTRLLAVSFVVYSPNIDVYVMFDAVVEFTKVGAITVGMETTTARLGTVWESRELFTLVMELLVMLFYVWYTLQELRRTLQVGFRRLLKFTTLAHDLNIFTYVTYWAFKLAAYYAAPTDVVVDSDVYYDFRTAIRMREIARLAMSGTVFIVLFKLLAYTAVIPSFGLLTRTIGNAAGPTISFLLISALLLYGFSAAYMIALGPRAFGFRNLATSATSLLRALLGDFDYEQIRRAHFLIGPILFIL